MSGFGFQPTALFLEYWQQVPSASLCASTWPSPTIHLLFPNPPSFTDLLEGQAGFFEEPELSIPTHIRASPWLEKGFCFVFQFSQEKAELPRAHFM